MAKKNKPQTLAEILSSSFREMGLREKLRRDKAVNSWAEVVGAEVAGVAKPIIVKNRVLFVAVESPSWINELNYYSDAIIKQLNRIAGREIIDKIRWQNTGELKEQPEAKEETAAMPPAAVEPSELPSDSPLAKKLEEITDEELKKSLKRLIEISRSMRKENPNGEIKEKPEPDAGENLET